jgi:DNA-binding NtrC family response regulator
MKGGELAMVRTLTNRPTVLVIDDEESIREGCRQTLEAEGYRTLVANDGNRGLRLVRSVKPRVVLVDLKMPGMNGMEALVKIHEIDESIVSIVITGYGTVDTAVQAMKAGAYDYVEKPLTPEQITGLIHKAIPVTPAEAQREMKLPEKDENEAFVIRLILRKAARDKMFGRKLLYQGRQELFGWALSHEAKSAIVSGNVAWLTKRCGGLSVDERKWLDAKPW